MPKFASAGIDDSPQPDKRKCKQVLVVGEGSQEPSKEELTPVRNEVVCIDDDNDVTPSKPFTATQATIDLANDLDNLTPLKRESHNNADLNLPLKMLKKTIKIEKN